MISCLVVWVVNGSFEAIRSFTILVVHILLSYSIAYRGCPPVQGKLCRISSVGLYPSACVVVVVAFHLASKVGC